MPKLWTPPPFNQLRMRRRERTVTLPTGERAKVWVDDSDTVTQIETADRLDGIARPKTVRIHLRKARR